MAQKQVLIGEKILLIKENVTRPLFEVLLWVCHKLNAHNDNLNMLMFEIVPIFLCHYLVTSKN